MNNAEKLAKIDELLQQVPSFKCKDGCADCCGPIEMSRLEFYRCIKASGRSVDEVNRQREKNLAMRDLRCPLLDRKTNRCSVYAVRPAICRVFGTVKELACPHGYQPEAERMLSDASARAILDQVKELGK